MGLFGRRQIKPYVSERFPLERADRVDRLAVGAQGDGKVVVTSDVRAGAWPVGDRGSRLEPGRPTNTLHDKAREAGRRGWPKSRP